LSGEKQFPTTKEAKASEHLKLFLESKYTLPGETKLGIYHATAGTFAKETSTKNKKVLIITDRTELLSQAGGTIESFDMNPFYIQAETKFIDKTKSIYIAMSQTLRNRMNNPVWREFIKNHIGLIIIDEAHKQEFNHVFDDGFLDNKYVIGFTATPTRGGKMKQLGIDYQAIVRGKPIKWLIKKGYLLNCDIRSPFESSPQIFIGGIPPPGLTPVSMSVSLL